MRFGFNFGIGGGTKFQTNIHVFIIGTILNVNGYILNSIGAITPNATFEGEDIYQATWDIVTGEFVISFGAAGTTEIVNVSSMALYHPLKPDGNIAIWDAVNTQYSFIDLELAQYIGTDTTRSEFLVEFLPELLQKFDMTISTGDGT